MQLVDKSISIDELKKMSEKMMDNLVKAVVDVERAMMVVNLEMHADGEWTLLENQSQQKHLWGINLHPEKFNNPDWIEFNSLTNYRPSWGNRSRGIDDQNIQEKIRIIVSNLVT